MLSVTYQTGASFWQTLHSRQWDIKRRDSRSHYRVNGAADGVSGINRIDKKDGRPRFLIES